MQKHEKFDEMFEQIQKYIDVMPQHLENMPAQLQQIAQKVAVLKLCWPLMKSHPGVQVDIEKLLNLAEIAWVALNSAATDFRNLTMALSKLPAGLSYRNPFHQPDEPAADLPEASA